MLWGLEHYATEHIPGKLTLCIGIPVMIRYNIATELCITKGQEGTIAGWDSKSGPHGKEILETLFVRLTDSPKYIHLDGLPLNVVPIVRIASSIKCRLIDDQVQCVDQLQVPILPNLAMTDYASQGKTRPDNVVELTNSALHQLYYNALSRSATSSGTVSVQSFSPGPITGEASGWLRQESCESEQLEQYCDWKGHSYVLKRMAKAISWLSKTPFK